MSARRHHILTCDLCSGRVSLEAHGIYGRICAVAGRLLRVRAVVMGRAAGLKRDKEIMEIMGSHG